MGLVYSSPGNLPGAQFPPTSGSEPYHAYLDTIIESFSLFKKKIQCGRVGRKLGGSSARGSQIFGVNNRLKLSFVREGEGERESAFRN